MGIREKLEENQAASLTVIILILAAILFVIWKLNWTHTSTTPSSVTSVFFSDDDGKTWFIDSVDNVPPFSHNGKMAVRAWLYRCGATGKPFVQYLQKYDDEAVRFIQADIKTGTKPANAMIKRSYRGLVVKRPGDTKWIGTGHARGDDPDAYAAVVTPDCPDKDGRLVYPSENVTP